MLLKVTDPRHPLRQRAAVLAILGILAGIAAELGIDQAQVDTWVTIAVRVVEVLVLLGVMVKASEGAVTPVADPRAPDGRALYTVDQAAQVLDVKPVAVRPADELPEPVETPPTDPSTLGPELVEGPAEDVIARVAGQPRVAARALELERAGQDRKRLTAYLERVASG